MLPVFLLVTILILATMPGSILFIQKRVGLNGKQFNLFKFRSMQVIKKCNNNKFEPGNLSRITPLGKFLRKYKIDETPQLFNILKGDMTFVGPRPEVLEWTKVYNDKWEIVHRVKPGITDFASILYRNEEELLSKSDNPIKTYQNDILPKKLEYYINYAQNKSFKGDIKIIFKTIYNVLFR